jgi:hypothetical protein
MSTMIDYWTFVNFGRQNRVFGKNETETEKNHDCVAECAVSRELFSPGYQGKLQGTCATPPLKLGAVGA